MKIHPRCGVLPDGSGLCCRQSRLAGLVAAILYVGILGGLPVLLWWSEAPWLYSGVAAAFAAVVLPMILSEVAARFRPSNWLLWLLPDTLRLNLRSYQDTDAADGPTVAEIDYRDIAEARRHVERYSTPSNSKRHSRQEIRWTEQYLELRLKRGVETLVAALDAERRRPRAERTYLGGISVSSRSAQPPVQVLADGTVRIAWRDGRGRYLAPSLPTVLTELAANGVTIAEETKHVRPRWHKLSEAEVEDLARHMAASGGTLGAVHLLVRTRGLTTTEAKRFVDACRTPTFTAANP